MLNVKNSENHYTVTCSPKDGEENHYIVMCSPKVGEENHYIVMCYPKDWAGKKEEKEKKKKKITMLTFQTLSHFSPHPSPPCHYWFIRFFSGSVSFTFASFDWISLELLMNISILDMTGNYSEPIPAPDGSEIACGNGSSPRRELLSLW